MKDVSKCLALGHVAKRPAPTKSAQASATRPARPRAARRSPVPRRDRDAMRGAPYRRVRPGRSFARRRPSTRGTRGRRRTRARRRRSSRTGTGSRRGRAPGSTRSASTASPARSRTALRWPPRTPLSCHAGARARSFRSTTRRTGRRGRAPTGPQRGSSRSPAREAPSKPWRRGRCLRDRARSDPTVGDRATGIKVGRAT